VSLRLAVSQYCPGGPLSDRASACAPCRRRRGVGLSLAGSARGGLGGALRLGRAAVRPTGARPAERDVEHRCPASPIAATRGAHPACGFRARHAGPRDPSAAGRLAHSSYGRKSTRFTRTDTQLEPAAARAAAGLAATAREPASAPAATADEPTAVATATVTATRDYDPATASCDPDPAAATGARVSAG
jgi:hypothetical protein